MAMTKAEIQKRSRERNPESTKASRAKWAANNPEKVKAAARRGEEKRRTDPGQRARRAEYRRRRENEVMPHLKKFGISADDYRRMLSAQGGVCAVCRRPCATGRRLAVDHCHVTGRVRGLLCSNCNRSAGLLRDDPVLIRALAAYLEAHR